MTRSTVLVVCTAVIVVTAGCFGSTSSPQPRTVTIPKGGDNSSINSTGGTLTRGRAASCDPRTLVACVK